MSGDEGTDKSAESAEQVQEKLRSFRPHAEGLAIEVEGVGPAMVTVDGPYEETTRIVPG